MRRRDLTVAAESGTSARQAMGAVLRALREAAGVTQDGWAARLGIARSTLNRWERGDVVPDAEREAELIALCREKALFRRYDAGPLAERTLSEEWLRELLAQARLGGATAPPAPVPPPVPDTPMQPGALAAPSIPPTNLPTPLTSFIARAHEQAEVQRLLATARLLTLTGIGGVGKTRLALEVARTVRDGYPDGVWLVELAALGDPTLVPRAVADALGAQEEAGRSLSETLITFLAGRRLLLVLDNCEHLVGACAQLTETLLRTCPGVQILATSREVLGTAGELRYRVPSLLLPTTQEAMSRDQLARYEAVQLFVERARAVTPAFAVTDETIRMVLEVCRRLDGIPLAIELAAARVNVLSVEQIVARLDDRFRLLTGGSRTALPRQQTLRAAVDWSYELLASPEQQLFDRLSVFAGGWTLAAAEAVCAGEDIASEEVLDLLSQLVDKSLVATEVHHGQMRYRLLETLRQYGWAHLDRDATLTRWRKRHLGWCLALAEQATPELTGPEQVTWLAQLEVEHDNLRAALSGAGDLEERARLGAALAPFWEARGYFSEGRRWLEDTITAGEGLPRGRRAPLLLWAGRLALLHAEYATAHPQLEEALALYRVLDDQRGIGAALRGLSHASYARGDLATAWAQHQEAQTRAQAVGDRGLLAALLTDEARLAQMQGQGAAARVACEQALALYRAGGDQRGIARSLNALGMAALVERDFRTAQAYLEEALTPLQALGDQQGIAAALANLGIAVGGQRDYTAARTHFADALRIAHQRRLLPVSTFVLAYMGILAQTEQQPVRAARLLGAATTLWSATGSAFDPPVRALIEDAREAARMASGDDVFAAAWAAGAALSVDEAVAEALGAVPAT